MNRNFILNADDLGMSKTRNKAILDACQKGFLKSTSLCVNGDEFDDAVKNVILRCPELGVGVHLNIIEGRALIQKSSLTNSIGNFRLSFIQLLLRSRNKKFLEDVEKEFRAQIEKALEKIKIDHLDSHIHTHGIPGIFKIVAALSKEYGIPCIRTQHEKHYIVPGNKNNITLAFAINQIKIFLLNTFTGENRKVLDCSHKTNDFLIGIGYTAMMDSRTIEYGLKKFIRKDDDIVIEALFHPDANCQNDEYQISFNRELEKKIKTMGFTITNYSGLITSIRKYNEFCCSI